MTAEPRLTQAGKGWITVLVLLLAIIMPLFFASMGLSLLAFTPAYYERMQLEAGWSGDPTELGLLDRSLVTYFWDGGLLPVAIQPRFTEKEQLHLADIAELLRILRLVTIVSGFIFLLFLVLLAWKNPRGWRRLFGGLLLWTALLLLALGIVIYFFFDAFFLQFHLLVFSNDFWLLGPEYLLFRLFPPDLFFRSILPYALVVGFLLLVFFLVSRIRRLGRRGPSSLPAAEPK